MAGSERGEDVVNWDGILTLEERKRILARIHSAFGAVGARIPETVVAGGRRLRLRETVFGYLERDRLTRQELEAVGALSALLEERARELEGQIQGGELDEAGAVNLMKEVLGLLRALEHLRKLRDPGRLGPARESLLSRVDDERRWLEFVRKVRKTDDP